MRVYRAELKRILKTRSVQILLAAAILLSAVPAASKRSDLPGKWSRDKRGQRGRSGGPDHKVYEIRKTTSGCGTGPGGSHDRDSDVCGRDDSIPSCHEHSDRMGEPEVFCSACGLCGRVPSGDDGRTGTAHCGGGICHAACDDLLYFVPVRKDEKCFLRSDHSLCIFPASCRMLYGI